MSASNASTVYLKDYQVPSYLVDTVNLRFELSPTATRVTAESAFRRNPDCLNTDIQWQLDGEELETLEISVNGQAVAADSIEQTDTLLTLRNLPEQGVLRVVTQLNPDGNKALSGLYRSSGMYCTQCEADGFRRITWFPDRPDVMSRYSVTVVGDAGVNPVMLSNGNLVDSGVQDDGQAWVKWDDPFPKPCYLFALVAGDLHCEESQFVTASNRQVTLRVFVEHENADKCEHAIVSLKKAMKWDEQVYGLEYDLDLFMIVAVNDFNMGAMENKGLNIFNSRCVLASPETATDDDYDLIESIVGHEYFHNWTGNRVTCRDWFQLSLKEGLTVYRDQEFSADMGSRGLKRVIEVRGLRGRQFREDAGPTAHPVRPDSYVETNNLYTATVYDKGAEVIRMMANLLGEQGFRRGMDLYFERHDGQAVTCDDFVAAMEDANSADLTLFRRWYTQAGTPQLTVGTHLRQHTALITLSQQTAATPGQADKQPLHIPVRVALLDKNGSPVELFIDGKSYGKETVLELTSEEQSWTFEQIKVPVTPSVLRGFSSPVELVHDLSREQKLFLMAKDRDGFSRANAAESLAIDEISQMTASWLAGRPLAVADDFINACGDLLRSVISGQEKDVGLVSEVLRFPTEAELIGRGNAVDVDAYCAAAVALRRQLGAALLSEWLAVRDLLKQHEDANQRRLSNLCLAYIAWGGSPQLADEACQAQLASAKNMSETLAALKPIVSCQLASAEQQLAAFETRWAGNQAVMGKWFGLQASVPQESTVEAVEALMAHPEFAEQNPNLVNALLMTMASQNPQAFHRKDGAGYRLLADEVLRTNDFNPQLAARLVTVFNGWKKIEGPRRQLMNAELNRISAAASLSRAVADIVSRALS